MEIGAVGKERIVMLKILRKASAVALAAVLLCCSLCCLCSCNGENLIEPGDESTMDFVLDMGIGINLGNTLEACGDWIYEDSVEAYETAWGSPVITKDMIKIYADNGFGVVRIPVAWSNMMGKNYKISDAYMKRVKQITDWVVDCGMKAIVNIHWDGGWFAGFSTDEDKCMEKYERVWEQICEGFKDYSYDVMFESLNEEGCWEDMWNRYSGSDVGKKEAFDLLGRINQKFVDVVRASGGNNPYRHLLIAGYGTDPTLTCDELYVLPEDPAERYAVSIHYYNPPTFCVIEEDVSWGKAISEWGSEEDYKDLEANMDMIYERFIKNGIPVIMGEYGCTKGNKTHEAVIEFMSAACEAMYVRGICPVAWDTHNHFIDRNTGELYDEELFEKLRDVKKLERKVK